MNKFENDSLGSRMKLFERLGSSSERFIPYLPVMVRLDGKAFHSFTKGLARPYDKRLSDAMVETTKFLVKMSNATIGYTQSDEITLVLFSDKFESQILFGGRRDKINSVMAGYATAFFNRMLPKYLPEKADLPSENYPIFDCRCYYVPTRAEACNALIWREQDATRNSIQMASQSMFSHKQLQNLDCNVLQEMMFKFKNVNWNDYPAFFKRGTYVQRKKVTKAFSTDELEKLPPKHKARTNPSLLVERHEISAIELPIFTKIVNREAVVFDGADPVTL